jgi:hypothetical protein
MKLRSYSRMLILVSLIALAGGSVFSQSMGGPPPIGGYRSPSADPDVVNRNSGRQRITTESRRDPMSMGSVPGNRGPVFKSESKLNAKERMLLATHPEDQNKYGSFLRQPDTGLFRLLPYESGGVVSIESLKSADVILPLKGRGAYYSYSKLRHELDGWSEIGLHNGRFEAGFVPKALGFMALLGNVPLEDVTLDSKGVGYLHKLDPSTTYQDIIAQGDEDIRRLRVGGISYVSTIAAVADNTYVLRSAISGKADLLVAFRVVRQEEDGSLHILWKKLASYPKPKLRNKPSK